MITVIALFVVVARSVVIAPVVHMVLAVVVDVNVVVVMSVPVVAVSIAFTTDLAILRAFCKSTCPTTLPAR